MQLGRSTPRVEASPCRRQRENSLTSPGYGTLVSRWTRAIRVRASEASSPSRLRCLIPKLIDYLAQVAWSVNEVEPDTGVFVRIRFTPQPIIGKVAQMNGWTTATYSSSTEDLKQFVVLPKAAVRQRFGDWPGPAPKAKVVTARAPIGR